jgi:hypothetical protein
LSRMRPPEQTSSPRRWNLAGGLALRVRPAPRGSCAAPRTGGSGRTDRPATIAPGPRSREARAGTRFSSLRPASPDTRSASATDGLSTSSPCRHVEARCSQQPRALIP